jgi:hypothetical protein
VSMIAIQIALHVVDGVEPPLESIFPPFSLYMKILGAVCLLAIPFALLGLIAALVPPVLGVVIAFAVALFAVILLPMTLFYYVMIDTGSSIKQTAVTSYTLVKQCPLRITWLVAVSLFINLAGYFLVTVGLLVTLPLSLIAGARVYRALSAVETAVDAPEAPSVSEPV